MLNKKHDEKSNSYGHKSDRKGSSRFEWSPKLRRIVLRNEEGELLNDTEEPPKLIIVGENHSFCGERLLEENGK